MILGRDSSETLCSETCASHGYVMKKGSKRRAAQDFDITIEKIHNRGGGEADSSTSKNSMKDRL